MEEGRRQGSGVCPPPAPAPALTHGEGQRPASWASPGPTWRAARTPGQWMPRGDQAPGTHPHQTLLPRRARHAPPCPEVSVRCHHRPREQLSRGAGPRPPPPCPAPADELNPQTLQAHSTPRPRFRPPRLLPGTCTAAHPPGSPRRLPHTARPLPAPLPQHPSAGLWVFAPHLGQVVARASPPARGRLPAPPLPGPP